MICGTCNEPGFRAIRELKAHKATACDRAAWTKVAELRRAGDGDAADRLARRAMGIKSEPMSEETKEKLRLWKEEHAAEIQARKDLDALTKARTRAIMKPAKGPIRRKA